MATVGDRRPEVSQNLSDVRFPGRGPRAVSLDTQYKKDVLWMGLGSASLPLKAQYLQNVALRLPGTKPHNNWLLLLRRLAFFSERLYIRNNLPFEIAFHSKLLRNNLKWPHGPIPSKAPLGPRGSP